MEGKVDRAKGHAKRTGASGGDRELERGAKLDRTAAEVREKVGEVAGRLRHTFGAEKK
jgi:uncharacterized protein YjbJ (UPF0337 family)